MQFWKKSLMAKLVIYFLVLSLLTISLVAYLAYSRARTALENAVFERLEISATLKENELLRWVKSQEQGVDFLAQSLNGNEYIENLLKLEKDTLEYEQNYEYLADYLNHALANHDGMQEIFILANKGGEIVISTEEEHEEEYRVNDEFFEKGKDGLYTQNVYPSPIILKPALTIAAPLYSSKNEQIAVLAVHLNLTKMDDIIFGGVSSTSHSGGVSYVVDEYGQLVSSEGFETGGLHNIESYGITKALEGLRNAAIYEDYKQILVIGNYRWIRDLNLALLVEIPEREAFAPARSLALTIILAGVSSAAILAIGVYLFARQIARPILAITDIAVQVTKGDLSQNAPVVTDDEIGVLARSFNGMQASLRQSRRRLIEYAHTLEDRVAERTAELEHANHSLSRRALQLEASSRVGQQVTGILDPTKVLKEIVSLIQARFDCYAVTVWLLDSKKGTVTLEAGSGRIDRTWLEEGLRLSLDMSSVIVSVCKTGTYRLVNNVTLDPSFLAIEELPDTQSELTLPLRIGNRVMGVLDIQSDEMDHFDDDDVMVFQTLADQIAIAIRNAQLYSAEQNRRTLAEALEKTGRVISSSLDLREVPARILEQVAQTVPYERGSVLLQEDNSLHLMAQHGFPDSERASELHVPITEGDVFHRVVQSRSPLIIDDVAKDPSWYQVEWLAMNHSWMGVPLISKGRVIGVISLTRLDIAAFTDDDASLVLTFAGQAAIALENASLYDQITRFNEVLEQRVQERTEELNNAYNTLERLDKAKADFISVTSHELRTPLTVISGYAQIVGVRPGVKEDETAETLLEGIINGVKRLNEIVDSMLDVSKIDMKELTTHKEPVSIMASVDRTFFKFEQALQERKLDFTKENLENLPTVQADPDLLLKVFYHVIGNAIKYTPDGGEIKVKARLLSSKSNGHGKDETDLVEISITDTGIGIAQENLELIFEKFYQTGPVALHSSGQTKFKGGGPGVGLAVAKGIILAHKGKIWAESDGHDEETFPGSTFYIQLPVGNQLPEGD